MKKKVFIRFLKQGLVLAETPENFDEMSAKEKMDWANKILKSKSDGFLVDALADFEDPDKNGFFAIKPDVCAIEQGEGMNIGDTIVSTSLWEMFNSPEWKNLYDFSDEQGGDITRRS